jgi:hypothetical protein
MPAPAIPLECVRFVGRGLQRPECVLATARGELYAADWRGADGAQTLYAGRIAADRPLRPNGIALRRSGTFLLADIGDTRGGVFELTREGEVRPFLTAVDGVDLPPTNFVAEDATGRVWVTVSTRKAPRSLDYRPDCAGGFIVLADGRGARIVADGIGYTNEAIVSPDGTWLYVNETFGRRLSRFPIAPDGSLGAKDVVTTFGTGDFPDGLTFDAEHHVWITAVVSNRIIRVAPDGAQQVMLADTDPGHVAECEAAYRSGTMGRAHLDRTPGRVLRNVSSLAFGGPDLRTAYVGCLLGDAIAVFDSPVAGHPPAHWRY